MVDETDPKTTLKDRVFAVIDGGGGVTITQLVEQVEATEKQIRNAVDALRKADPEEADEFNQVVSWRRKYWLASELRDKGLTLKTTARGTLKVTDDAGGETSTSREDALTALKAAVGDHPDAERINALVVVRFDDWQKAKIDLKTAREEARNLEAGAAEEFRTCIEKGHSGTSDDEAKQKLHETEMAWQNWEEKKGEAKEMRSIANATLKKADRALASLIDNARQLDLWPGGA
jgi:hypothetical protein